MKTLHEKASYIACGGNYQPGSVRYNRVYERAEDEIGEVLDENERLQNEIERLRGALEVIAESSDSGRHDGKPEECPAYDDVYMWAVDRQALKGQTDE